MSLVQHSLKDIDGLIRQENTPLEKMQFLSMELTHTVYSHDSLYSQFIPIQIYINCPPEEVFDYMANTASLNEWAYSTRELHPVDESDLYRGVDFIGGRSTAIYARTVANKEALTVDYHCAWDQGEELWMIYLNRIVPAPLVLKKPGSVVFWQNCKHPYYDSNPYPEKAPHDRPWVGEFWDFFYAGHTIEFTNLKRILEYRHTHNLPMGPYPAGGEK